VQAKKSAHDLDGTEGGWGSARQPIASVGLRDT
jgi:hypothetical protein